MADIVIREVAPDLWTFSKPFALFGRIHLGGRSTAVKLSTGDVFVVASTPLSPETKETLDGLGPVKYIIGINSRHNMFLGEFKRAYPEAKLLAPAAVARFVDDKSLIFDGMWGRDAPETKYGFEEEIEACYFSEYLNKDVVFFHHASKTMITADLITNLPGIEQYSKSDAPGSRFPFYGPLGKPSGWLQGKMLASRVRDPEVMKAAAKTVAEWDWDRLIMAHGDVIESGGKQTWLEAFKAYL
uniref:DUF4336 domain-containing protein n=1 Tax=Mycena chlorophos TaxID=658473 RepID=A0ABQ0LUM2_MYCCL|nr:predicted protein [Mycena chlorophos]